MNQQARSARRPAALLRHCIDPSYVLLAANVPELRERIDALAPPDRRAAGCAQPLRDGHGAYPPEGGLMRGFAQLSHALVAARAQSNGDKT